MDWSGQIEVTSSSHLSSSLRVALVGAGRVGTAVTELLRRRGHVIVGVASRSRESAERAASALGVDTFALGDPLPDCDLVLIGTSDDAVAEIAGRLAPVIAPGTLVWHFAGVLGIELLRPIGDVGGGACACHPVQSCPDVATAITRLPGSAWGVTCATGLTDWASELIARDLDGVPVAVAEADRPLWHAAAATTAGGIAAVLAGAEAILATIGVEQPQNVLGPLAAGVVANARDLGDGGTSLTGPVVRSQTATIERHLAALRDRAPDLLEVYERVVEVILVGARRSGRIDAATHDRLKEVLTSS
ncbi:MAG: Rossmann-like and DUF2520 domain-containing protein [Actinomycetota bacterium]